MGHLTHQVKAFICRSQSVRSLRLSKGSPPRLALHHGRASDLIQLTASRQHLILAILKSKEPRVKS